MAAPEGPDNTGEAKEENIFDVYNSSIDLTKSDQSQNFEHAKKNWYYVAVTVNGKMNTGGPFELFADVVKCDNTHVELFGVEHYIERHALEITHNDFRAIKKKWKKTQKKQIKRSAKEDTRIVESH
jgi:hypothetical protein